MVTRIDDSLGEELVRLARRSIETALRGGDPEELLNGLRRSGLRRGVFVTLYQHPSMELRGCIGRS